MSERILIVDDEVQIRRVIRSTLTPHGYDVHEARNGEEAVQSLRDSRFDLVLLDINMPGMDGIAACRAMRAYTDVAIIMLTVSESEEDKVTALDAGADDYVTKPFRAAELLARIRAAVRRVPSAQSKIDSIQLGEWQINLSLRRVIGKGREIRLTPKEVDLLVYMSANPNVPIPHARLLQAVWGPEYVDQVQYLRVFVTQLRKKIEADPSHPRYILTEPWVGYRFAPPR